MSCKFINNVYYNETQTLIIWAGRFYVDALLFCMPNKRIVIYLGSRTIDTAVLTSIVTK